MEPEETQEYPNVPEQHPQHDHRPPGISDVHVMQQGTPEQLAALYGAMAKAQGAFTQVVKSATVEYNAKNKRTDKWELVTYPYATISDLRKATQKGLAENGLAIMHMPSGRAHEGPCRMTTILGHAGGGAIIHTVSFNPGRDIKELGGTETYLRRYAYQCLCAVEGEEGAEENDPDLNSATKPVKAAKPDEKKAQDKADNEPWDRLNHARKTQGLNDGQVTKVCRAWKDCAPGNLDGPDIRRLARLISAMTHTEVGVIKEGDLDAIRNTVGEVKDRLVQADKS